jgi:hypothetical protein
MTLVTTAVLCATLSAASAKPPVQLASPGLSGLRMSPDELSFYSEHLAQQFRLRGMRVLTSGDIGTLLGLERQKQLLSCGQDSTSCTLELANALGADAVVVGNLAKLGDSYQLDVRVLAANTGEALSARSAKASTDERLVAAMDQLAVSLVAEVNQRLGRETAVAVQPVVEPQVPVAAVTTPVPAPRGPAHRSWLVATSGFVVMTAGFIVWGVGTDQLTSVKSNTTMTYPQAKDAVQAAGTTIEVGSWMMLGGVALGVGAGVWRIASIGDAPAVQPGVAVGPSGATLVVSGALPWP